MRGVGRWESRNQKKKEVVYWTSEEETKQSKKKNTKLSMERMEDQELMTTIESRDFQILSLTQPSNPPATKIS